MLKPICVVVGMGKGVSLSVAKRFGALGYRIAMIARRAESLAAAEEALLAEGIESISIVGDAGDIDSIQQAFRELDQIWGHAEVLVYNAYSGKPGLPSAINLDTLVQELTVNVVGAVAAIQCVAPAMKEGKKGTILLTGGGFAIDPMPRLASLGMGKAALRNLALSAAKELEPLGIRVGTVTIAGLVAKSGRFHPDTISDAFLTLFHQAPGEPNEIVFADV